MRVRWENVVHAPNRRRRKECRKRVTAGMPGVDKYARVPANYAAAASAAHAGGFSHGRTADYCTDVLKGKTSRPRSYRNKISAARRLKPEHDAMRRETLDDPYLACDGPRRSMLGRNGGKVMVARGENTRPAGVAWSADKEAVKKTLPGYAGAVGRYSNTTWLHTGGDRQLRMRHRRRLSKTDLRNLKGDPKKFVTALRRLDYLHHMYDEIEDPRVGIAAAWCLEKTRSELLNAEYGATGRAPSTSAGRGAPGRAISRPPACTRNRRGWRRTTTARSGPTSGLRPCAATAGGTARRREWTPTP